MDKSGVAPERETTDNVAKPDTDLVSVRRIVYGEFVNDIMLCERSLCVMLHMIEELFQMRYTERMGRYLKLKNTQLKLQII